MSRQRLKRTHRGIRDNQRKFRTRARTKDLDQIHSDLVAETYAKLKTQPVDPDRPGCAQHYCVECSRYFVDATSLQEHTRSKIHKKRVKLLKEEPYTQKDAEAAVGLTVDNRPKFTAIDVIMQE